MLVLRAVSNNLRRNQTLSGIASRNIQLAIGIKGNGTEVVISSLILPGDCLLEKGKEVNDNSKEECFSENFQILLHENKSGKLDLFPDALHLNKKGLG